MQTLLGSAVASEGGVDQLEGNLIRDVWYGRRGLGETYWKWGFLGGFATVLALVPFAMLAAAMESVVPIIVYLVLMIPYQVWISVGLWRSASAHGGFWGGLVRVLVALNVVLTPIRYVQLLADVSR